MGCKLGVSAGCRIVRETSPRKVTWKRGFMGSTKDAVRSLRENAAHTCRPSKGWGSKVPVVQKPTHTPENQGSTGGPGPKHRLCDNPLEVYPRCSA